MRGQRQRLCDAIYGAVLALTLCIPVWTYLWYLPEVPYSSVVVRDTVIVGNEIQFTATFKKNDACTFDSIGAFGGDLGVWKPLYWRDLETPQGDRYAGYNTLRIAVTLTSDITEIEIRTRHFCDGVKEDMVFLNYELN